MKHKKLFYLFSIICLLVIFLFSFSPPGAGPEGKILVQKEGGHKVVELIVLL